MKYQHHVDVWMRECFGDAITENKQERLHRFVEEALELAQACGYTSEQALGMVDYVFRRPAGEPKQEVGGTMVCLAALCNAIDVDMEQAAESELHRCHEKTDKIRAKHAAKPVDIRGDYA